ncbi:MAG: hypothetical protein RL685_2428 [Pseudomonadota bacterium]|jgi:predicted SnoaL-like aldol condensation-catalyzing enzyme
MNKLLISSVSLGFLSLALSCSSNDDAASTPGVTAPSGEGTAPTSNGSTNGASNSPAVNGTTPNGTEQTVSPALPANPAPAVTPPAATSPEGTPPAATPPENTAALQPALPVVANADHEQLLSSTVPALAANKRLVYDMWRTLIEARNTQAAEQYFAEGYIQHNPNADTGRAGVLAFFASQGAPQTVQARVQTPLVAVVAERDYVALVQVNAQQQPRPYTTTWFDLFRIEGGLIAEHWDHGQLPDGGMPGGYVPPVVTTDQAATLGSDSPLLAGNKQLVYDMWRTLLDAQQVEEAPRFLAEGYIQHNPQANTGLQGFLSFFRQFAQPQPVQPTVANFIQIIAEGDLVVLATVRSYTAAAPYTTTWFDMFRVNEGLLVEHWDTATLQ